MARGGEERGGEERRGEARQGKESPKGPSEIIRFNCLTTSGLNKS